MATDRDRFTESTLFPYLLYGVAFAGVGVAVGFADVHNVGIQKEEGAVLLGSGGAAVGLLAVVLAAVALLLAFLTGPYKQIIEAVGVTKFFWPFVPVAVLSAGAAVIGLAGALDNENGPVDARATLDGIALGLFAAAVVGVVYLIWVFLFHAGQRQAAETATSRIGQPQQSSRGSPTDANTGTLTRGKNPDDAYGSAGRLDQAIPKWEFMLVRSLRVAGTDHPETLIARNNLAYSYLSAGRLGEAILLFEQNLADSMRVLGVEHPDTLMARKNLARWIGEAGDAAAARDQYAAFLPTTERVLGPEHPETLATRAELARWTGEAGDAAAARGQYAALLRISERVLGPEHPDTLATRSSLAHWTARVEDDAWIARSR